MKDRFSRIIQKSINCANIQFKSQLIRTSSIKKNI